MQLNLRRALHIDCIILDLSSSAGLQSIYISENRNIADSLPVQVAGPLGIRWNEPLLGNIAQDA